MGMVRVSHDEVIVNHNETDFYHHDYWVKSHRKGSRFRPLLGTSCLYLPYRGMLN